MTLAHQNARDRLVRPTETRKARHDRGARKPSFKEGDRGYVRAMAGKTGVARNLAAKWSGPFKVIELMFSITPLVRNECTEQQTVVHVNMQKHTEAQPEPVDSMPQGNRRCPHPENGSPGDLGKTHCDQDGLIHDIHEFERVDKERCERFGADREREPTVKTKRHFVTNGKDRITE